MTSPCQLISFQSRMPVRRQWMITVHTAFAINITIYKAYLPFSNHCGRNSLVIHEGRDNFPIQWFCGNVAMESVFTAHHKGLIYFNSKSLETTMMTTSYQVSGKGLAYKVTALVGGFLPTMNISRRTPFPNVRIYIMAHIEYFWYLVSALHVAPTEASLRLNSVRILSLNCYSVSTSLSVYPGLLSWYLARWTASPVKTVKCNTSKEENVHIISHMFGTVILKVPVSNYGVQLTMVMGKRWRDIKRVSPTAASTTSFTDRILHGMQLSHSYLHSGILSTEQSALSVDSFGYAGPKTSVNIATASSVGYYFTPGRSKYSLPGLC